MKFEEMFPRLKKGIRVKRRGWENFHSIKDDKFRSIELSDMQADDWELETIKRDLTKKDLAEAWDAMSAKVTFYCPSDESNGFAMLAQELGLE